MDIALVKVVVRLSLLQRRSFARLFPHGATVWRADFKPHACGERGRQAQARTKNPDDERIPPLDDFKLASDTYAKRLKPLNVFTIGFDAANNGACSR